MADSRWTRRPPAGKMKGSRVGEGRRRMAIDLTCPCGRKLRVGEEHAGKQGRCPVCERVLAIPQPGSAAGPPPPAAVLRLRPVELPPPAAPPDVSRAAAAPFAESTRPRGVLYPPEAVAVATFLGSLLAGFVVLTINYGRLKKPLAAGLCALCGLAGGAASLGVLLSGSWTPLVVCWLHLGSTLGMYVLARTLQGARYAEHLRRGGARAPAGRAIGLGLLHAFLLMAVAVIGPPLVGYRAGGTVVFHGVEEVRFTRDVTRAEARRVGILLQEMGLFDGTGRKTVRLEREDRAYVVTVVIPDLSWDDVEVLTQMVELRERLAGWAFPGHRVLVRLVDKTGSRRRTLRGPELAR
jgi:hypothetical protein